MMADIAAHIRGDGLKPALADLNCRMVVLGKNRAGCGDIERTDLCVSPHRIYPGLAVRSEIPEGPRWQIPLLEHKVRVGNEKAPGIGKSARDRLAGRRTGICCCDRSIDVKLALASVVEDPKCGVTSLLDFDNHKSRTDRMDRSSRDENDVVSLDT